MAAIGEEKQFQKLCNLLSNFFLFGSIVAVFLESSVVMLCGLVQPIVLGVASDFHVIIIMIN